MKGKIFDLASVGSGEALAQQFGGDREKKKGHSHILLWTDELHSLTKKCAIDNSSLGQKLLELYEGNRIAHHVKDQDIECYNAHLAIMTSTTPNGFAEGWVGTGADEGGLLSRFVIEYADAIPGKGFRFRSPGQEKLRAVRERIRRQLDQLPMELGIEPAAAAILESWWTHREEKRHDARLDGYAKRVAMILALTSDKTSIDLDIVEPVLALALAERQSTLRAEFFPQDAKNIVEKFELQISEKLTKSGSMSKRDLVRATNVHRPGSGGAANFNRALQELERAGTVVMAGKNQRGNPLYVLARD